MKQHLFSRFFDFVLSPIRHNFTHFVMIFVLASGFQIFSQFLMNDPLRNFNIVTMFMWGLVIAYLGSGIIMITPPKLCLRNITIGIIYSLLVLSSLADIIIFSTLNTVWNNNFWSIIAGTNSKETIEFIEFYFGFKSVLYAFGWLLSILSVLFFLKLLRRLNLSEGVKSICSLFFFLCVVVSSCYLIRVGKVRAYYVSMPGKLVALSFYFHSVAEPIQSPKLEIERHSNIDSPIFLVIGESHSRLRTQLYGYDKNNMPLLSSYPTERLIVYYGIESPATSTEESFRKFLTPSEFTDVQWNRTNTVIQLMHEIGYKTLWLSNQSCHGVCDNYINRFANLCDSAIWTGNAYDIELKWTSDNLYDGQLLQIYDNLKGKISDKSFVVFHLMGSHVVYQKRYPKNFRGFKSSQYADRPKNQREDLAAYDTSILYTDYVLNEVFRRAKQIGAIVIYFSDHATDLFMTDPGYRGQAKINNPESVRVGKQIPFMVYVPEVFEKEHPDLVSRIRKAAKQKGNTNQLFFTLMDVLGVSSPQWPDAAKHSLFYVD